MVLGQESLGRRLQGQDVPCEAGWQEGVRGAIHLPDKLITGQGQALSVLQLGQLIFQCPRADQSPGC